jgi:hypothetical protein
MKPCKTLTMLSPTLVCLAFMSLAFGAELFAEPPPLLLSAVVWILIVDVRSSKIKLLQATKGSILLLFHHIDTARLFLAIFAVQFLSLGRPTMCGVAIENSNHTRPRAACDAHHDACCQSHGNHFAFENCLHAWPCSVGAVPSCECRVCRACFETCN